MRMIVTGGGTGGHIYPAIAIADKFRKEDPDTEILYVGCHEGFESTIVPKAGYDLKLVDARWINKSNTYQLIKTAVRVLHGYIQSRRVIRKFKPDFIVGTGGYVCFPVILAGAHMHIPCYLHEQNAFPGLANRKLEKYVRKIFLGFKDGGKYFHDQSKTVDMGNPVREAFFNLDKKTAREKLGYGENDFIVLSFGGSLGAETINDVAFLLMKKLNGMQNTQMVFGTGKWYYDDVMKKISDESVEVKENIRVKAYIDDMDNYLMASDIVISRAGALSCAETTVAGKAAVLIPSPNVAGNHQYYNAKSLKDAGGAILVEEKDLDADKLVDEVMKLKDDRELLKKMGEASYSIAPLKALDIVYSTICQDVKTK